MGWLGAGRAVWDVVVEVAVAQVDDAAADVVEGVDALLATCCVATRQATSSHVMALTASEHTAPTSTS